MTNRKIKFLPIFLISIACLIASVGFTGVNAHAENCDSANNGEHTITFKAASGNGHIEGPTEYKCYGDCGPVSQANESTLKMFEFGPMSTTEIKAVPNDNYDFVTWTRSDKKEFYADIDSDVEFVANFHNKDFAKVTVQVNNPQYGKVEILCSSPWIPKNSKLSNQYDPTLVIYTGKLPLNSSNASIQEKVQAVCLDPSYTFVEWTRSDGKEWDSEIGDEIVLTANFKVKH
ncbi:MAG: hypothetical protein Q4E88_03895 [Coriobacteriia bacterium]|nr:hypothetical protein [Coriobacteriia bacterium]